MEHFRRFLTSKIFGGGGPQLDLDNMVVSTGSNISTLSVFLILNENCFLIADGQFDLEALREQTIKRRNGIFLWGVGAFELDVPEFSYEVVALALEPFDVIDGTLLETIIEDGVISLSRPQAFGRIPWELVKDALLVGVYPTPYAPPSYNHPAGAFIAHIPYK